MNLMPITFVNYKVCVRTQSYFRHARNFKTAFAKNVSYFVFNTCHRNSAVLQLKSSPDGKVWMNDGQEVEIAPKELITLVPNYFSKYSALEYKSKINCHPAILKIWFQMTRPPAKSCFGVKIEKYFP